MLRILHSSSSIALGFQADVLIAKREATAPPQNICEDGDKVRRRLSLACFTIEGIYIAIEGRPALLLIGTSFDALYIDNSHIRAR